MTTVEAGAGTEQEVASGAAADDGPGSGSESGRWRAALAVVVPTAVVGAHATLYGQWIEDDAGITFAFARNVATGNGFVLQPGALPVEGFSDPLWLAILVVGHWLGLFDQGAWFGVPDLALFPKLVALACCAGMFACLHTVARVLTRRPVLVTIVAGVLTAAVPSFVIWCFSGLENALFALMVVALAAVLVHGAVAGVLLQRRVAWWAGLLAAGAALTRPDGLIYVLAFPLVVVLVRLAAPRAERLWAITNSVVAFALPTAAYLLLRLSVFGDWLPNTARAKAQGLPGVAGLNRPVELIAYAGWLLVAAVAVAVVLVLSGRSSPARSGLLVLIVPLGLAVTAFAVLNEDWMPQYRFATPVWALGVFAGVIALGQLLAESRPQRRAAVAAVVAVALTVSGAGWVVAAQTAARAPTAPICSVALQTGYLINSYADALGVRDGTLLGVDAGGTSLTTRLRFVDYDGLADASIARLRQSGDTAGLRDFVLEQVRPTFTRISTAYRGEVSGRLLSDPRFARDYVEVERASANISVYVRRDAVGDPAALDRAREFGTLARAQISQVSEDGDLSTGWPCPWRLRPAPFPYLW